MTQRNERAAIEVVAKRLTAAGNHRRGSADGSLTLAGKRIALEVVAIRTRAVRASRTMNPRLRLDKVALGVIGRLRAALQGSVPDDRTIIVTITAPIRLASKTAAAMVDRIRRRLEGGAVARRSTHRIHGNTIQIWILKGGTATTSKLVGFVHNPNADPRILIEVARALLAAIGPQRRTAPSRSRARWLVIADQDDLLPVETYRNVCGQLRLLTSFRQIVVARAGGGVERLSRRPPHDRYR
jgi:hypothetical protein